MKILASWIAILGIAAASPVFSQGRCALVLDAYGRLVGELGAGVLTARDLKGLRAGDPFTLDSQDSPEALAIADGLSRLGDHVGMTGEWDDSLRRGIERILDARLEAMGIGTQAQSRAVKARAVLGEIVQDWPTAYGREAPLSVSADGSRVAVIQPGLIHNHDVFVLDGVTGNQLWRLGNRHQVDGTWLSDDGTVLLTAGRDRGRFWDLTTAGDKPEEPRALGTSRRLPLFSTLGDRNGNVVVLGFTDKSSALVVLQANRLHFVDVRTGKARNEIALPGSLPPYPDGLAALSPDGARLALAVEDPALALPMPGRLRSPQRLMVLDLVPVWKTAPAWRRWFHRPARARGWDAVAVDHVSSLAWSDDGKKLVFGHDVLHPKISVWDLDTKDITFTLETFHAKHLKVSSDGRYAAFYNDDKQIWVLDTQEKKPPFSLPPARGGFEYGFAGPKHLWHYTDGLDLWNAETAERVFAVSQKDDVTDSLSSIHLRPTRNRKIFGSKWWNGQVRVLDLGEILKDHH